MQYYASLGQPPSAWSGPLDVLPYSSLGYYHLPSLALDPGSGNAYVAAARMGDNGRSAVVFTRSLDDGNTWQPPINLGTEACVGSNLAVGPDGTIHVVWVDVSLGRLVMARSYDQGATFAPPISVADVHDNLGMRPMGWRLRDANFGLRIYPHYLTGALAPNFPAIAVDRSDGPTRGNLYVTWAEHAEGTVSPAENILGETGNNDFFETATPVPINSDVSGSYTDVHVGVDRDIFRLEGAAGEHVWISGRGIPSGIRFVLYRTHPDGRRIPTDGGFLFDPNAPPDRPRIPIPTILTLPSDGPLYFTLGSSGPFSASYTLSLRRFTPSPTSAARDMRDIVMVRSTDGGATWGPKVRVNHDPPGADQHMPNVAVDERGQVYVAWYDRRGIPFGDSANAYAAVSTDGGLTFGPDLKLSSRPSDWFWGSIQSLLAHGELMGDRIALAAGDDYGIVAWADMRNSPERSDIYAARIVDIPTAVEAVSDLTGEPTRDGVRLQWVVNDLRAVSGLRVHRSGADAAEAPLGEADLVPTPEGAFEYLDTSAEPGRAYTYRLAVRSGSETRWLGPVTVQVPQRITTLAWRAAWPNPFGQRTSVKLAVPQPAEGSIRVYDVQGKAVRTLAEGRFEPGEWTVEWDGRDAAGGLSAPGLYFVAAEVGGERARLRIARVP